MIGASWRDSTKRQYNVYIKKWILFCAKNEWTHTKVGEVLKFFDKLFYDENAGYNVINSARSALASVVNLDDCSFSISTHPWITRYLKGVFHCRPPVPRYKSIWDVSTVLTYLRRLSPAHKLPLDKLTHKVCTLLALVSAQRVQTFHALTLDNVKFTSDQVDIVITTLLKQSRPGNVGLELTFKPFLSDKRLCILHYLRQYIRKTQELRGQERGLFITHKRPYHKATRQTISRWIRETLNKAGINTDKFSAHSTRAASTSSAKRQDVPLSLILRQAGWKGEKVFQEFYLKPVEGQQSFSQAVLEQN